MEKLSIAGSSHMCRTLAAAAVLAAAASAALAAGNLENPPAGATVSGIGLVSGWNCSAARVEIEIDGTTLAAARGTDRLDTATVCGRRDTGFGLLLNWGLLFAGTHTVRALADGVEFGRSTVTAVSLGGEFLTGKSATVTLNDFPSVGRSSVIEWRESTQGFVVREVRDGAPSLAGRWNGANLENRSQCSSADHNGTHGTYAQYDITFDQGMMGIAESGITGLNCTYTGPYSQNGTARQASGAYICSDGKRGDFTAKSFLVTPNEMSIRLDIRLDTTETCVIDAILGGSRF
jgi:hypothetical protein